MKRILIASHGTAGLSFDQVNLFRNYIDLVESWNQRINLVSSADIHRIASKHILESLEFTRLCDLSDSSPILDLGSGAGFPGIPIAICRPEVQVVLCDARRKKAVFLRDCAARLSLKNVTVINARAEALQSEYAKQFALVTARAVAALAQLWVWCKPMLVDSGMLVSQKGGDVSQEVKALRNDDKVHVRILEFSNPEIAEYELKKLVCVSVTDKFPL